MSNNQAGSYALVALLLFSSLAFAQNGSSVAEAVKKPPPRSGGPTCTGGPLAPGTGGDLEVTGPCTVGSGTYQYRNVNIYGGGSLTFSDAVIDFWAQSILVENHGSLIAAVVLRAPDVLQSAEPSPTGLRITDHRNVE